MDLAQAFNAPVSITLGGREFSVRQLKLREWAPLQAWLKTAVPSPITFAIQAAQEVREQGGSIDPATERAMFAQAQQEARGWPPAVLSAPWFEAIDGIEEGWRRVAGHILYACGAKLGPEEFDLLMDGATVGELMELVRMAGYGDPPEAPKAPPATMTSPSEPAPEAVETTGA